MTRMVIVYKELSDAIYAKIDEQLKLYPGAKIHRENFFNQLLSYYDEHGRIPDCKIKENNPIQKEEK